MRFISTKVHGVLDYIVGLILVALPWLLGFAQGGAETWVPVSIGIAALVYSLFTDYELGVFRKIRMSGHLLLDFLNGVFLAASPWLFNFDEQVYLPHLVLGLFEIGAYLTTRCIAYPKTPLYSQPVDADNLPIT